ncbi:aldehyde dehydrogenase (NADP(+)) [Pedobacter sp.]
MHQDHTVQQIDELLTQSQAAFYQYKNLSLKQRAHFLRTIAQEIEALGDELIQTAAEETHLSEQRLIAERRRTIFQLTSYADAAERGNWLEARIDTGNQLSSPPKPDLRKLLVPLGPVVVFGASNFPFAYSTAGGDTACAFAAGCPVIVKAHPAHVKTSTLVADAIYAAVKKCEMPTGIFAHIYGKEFAVGEYLVKHDVVKAVGFTGSYSGGRALFDLAAQRKNPIPVFAEMGSVNPVFLLPDKVAAEKQWIAEQLTKSITQDMGQFCTNPGLLVGINNDDLEGCLQELVAGVAKIDAHQMLHEGIAKNFKENRLKALGADDVKLLYESKSGADGAKITIASVPARSFLENQQLHEEVFGPFTLAIICDNEEQLHQVAHALEGQLTTTLMASDNDLTKLVALLNILREKCGRLILNGVPTGVEVALAMQHGGPFPSCTDSRFTAVGADGIKRFARPVSFQNWNNQYLPDELKDENPLNIWRTVNNELTKEKINNPNNGK